MEVEMTLSRLADWIIVISFFSLCGAGIGYIIAEFVTRVIDGIRKMLKRHKERKAQTAENQPTE